ncbi:MAG: hypothetical protein ACYDBQ_07250 [Thermoplasmatota archaeon]
MAIASIFFSTVLLSFALVLFLAGLFGAFYGQGRSRALGFLLCLFALLLGGLFTALTWSIVPGVVPVFDPDTVGRAWVAVIAGVIGSGLAIGAFILSVMRS